MSPDHVDGRIFLHVVVSFHAHSLSQFIPAKNETAIFFVLSYNYQLKLNTRKIQLFRRKIA